jgi:hypothetical protein
MRNRLIVVAIYKLINKNDALPLEFVIFLIVYLLNSNHHVQLVHNVQFCIGLVAQHEDACFVLILNAQNNIKNKTQTN